MTHDSQVLDPVPDSSAGASDAHDNSAYERGYCEGRRRGDEDIKEILAAEFGELAETLQNGYGIPMRAAYADALLHRIEVHHDAEGWQLSLTVGVTTIQIGRSDAEKLRDELSAIIKSAHEVQRLRANFRAQNRSKS